MLPEASIGGAVRAVFDMYTRARMPYYLYAEINGIVDKRAAASLDEANAVFAALEMKEWS